MNVLFLAPADSRLDQYRSEIDRLIDDSQGQLKLTRSERLDYFTEANEFALAITDRKLVGFMVITSVNTPTEALIGFRLAVVHPDCRGHSILGKLGARCFRHLMAKVAFHKIRHPMCRIAMFFDICNPDVYRRYHFGQKIYPDFLRKESADDLAQGLKWRRLIAERVKFHSLDVDSGINGKGVQVTEAKVPNYQRRHNDGESQLLKIWRERVPSGCDLLVVVPIPILGLLAHIPTIIQYRLLGRAKRETARISDKPGSLANA